MKKKICIFLYALLLSNIPSGLSNPDSLLPLHEKVIHGKLKNGLRYYILKNRRPENRAELRLVVHSGSNNENDEQQGLAHFTEHMAFNGTKKYKKSEIVDYLESIGTKFGPDLNAYTSFDETVYMLQIPTDKKEIVEKGIDILFEWSAHVSMDSVEVEKERGVVLEEWRLGKGPMDRMLKKIYPVLFRNSRYAQRLPIGKPEILQNFKQKVLKEYYQKWYKPEIQSIVVVGDINTEQIEELIKKKFAQIPSFASPVSKSNWSIPATGEFTCVVASDPESPFNLLQWISFLPKEKTQTHSDFKRTLILSLALSMLNYRLSEFVSKPDPPFSFAGVNVGEFLGNVNSLTSFVLFPNGKWDKALEVLVTELQRVKIHGFTDVELELAKKELLKEAEDNLKEADKTESKNWASMLVQHVLRESPVLSAETRFRLTKKFLDEISLQDIQNIKNIFMHEKANNTTVAFMMTEKENNPVPQNQNVLDLTQKILSRTDIPPYVPKKLDKPFLSSKPIKQKILRQEPLQYGFTQWTLGNGVKVWLKPTNFKNNEILLSAYSHGGESLYPDEEFLDVFFAEEIQEKMNFGQYDLEQMEKFLSDKNCSLSFDIKEFSEEIIGSSSVKDLEIMLQWIYAGFTQPRLDSNLFLSWKNSIRPFYENNKTPERIFSDSLNYYLYNKHPRKKPILAKDLDKISLSRAHRFFKERFYDPSDFTFILVGSFHPDSIKPLIEKYIGGISNGSRKEKPGNYFAPVYEKTFSRNFYAGTEPKNTVQLLWNANVPFSQRRNFEARCLSMLLGILLRENLREEKGGVYGVGFMMAPVKYPKEMVMARCMFSCSPDNVNVLIQSVHDEIKKVKEKGCSDKNIVKIKETLLKELEQNEKENNFWINFASSVIRTDEKEWPSLDEYKKWIRELKGEDFKKWAQDLLPSDSYKQFVLNPLKK